MLAKFTVCGLIPAFCKPQFPPLCKGGRNVEAGLVDGPLWGVKAGAKVPSLVLGSWWTLV